MLTITMALIALAACGSRTGLNVDMGAAEGPGSLDDATVAEDAGRMDDAIGGPDVAVPVRDAGVDAHDANTFDAPFDADACPVCVPPYSQCKMTPATNGANYRCCAPGNGSTRCCPPGVGSIATGTGCPPADAATGVTQCSWPPALNDAAPRACRAARAFVACSYPSGAGCECLSDGATSCPGCGPGSGATCHDNCAGNEYAVACGGVGPPLPDAGNSNAEPPSTCHLAGVVPAGIAFYCCPCE
jgi:hypothetical protein